MRDVRSIYRSVWIRMYRYLAKSRFRSFGKNVYLFPGIDVTGPGMIEIGDNVIVLDDTVLAAEMQDEVPVRSVLRIGAGCNIGRRNHIYAQCQIVIEPRVLTASNVYISDCTHSINDITLPIMDQPVIPLNPVTIGEGAWIGQNVCIIGCKIGRNCVIGANSVVLEDIPDFAVAAGVPARVLRIRT